MQTALNSTFITSRPILLYGGLESCKARQLSKIYIWSILPVSVYNGVISYSWSSDPNSPQIKRINTFKFPNEAKFTTVKEKTLLQLSKEIDLLILVIDNFRMIATATRQTGIESLWSYCTHWESYKRKKLFSYWKCSSVFTSWTKRSSSSMQ